MDQLRLGSSGLHVSRLALAMMSFGDTSRRRWVLDESAAEPIVWRAIEGGHQLLRHCRHVRGRCQRDRHRGAQSSCLSDLLIEFSKMLTTPKAGATDRKTFESAKRKNGLN
jgi:hypothetical protein